MSGIRRLDWLGLGQLRSSGASLWLIDSGRWPGQPSVVSALGWHPALAVRGWRKARRGADDPLSLFRSRTFTGPIS